ncbi:hypothetical protein P152DRAFT_455872 [Eremomyces bilateralis CBS 781.70]|uniref:Uncharacterized protein n=1 Tax=Eremomyces bilateralis CBS 781.70 TaxID=1392243 RepID=A0A6G1G9X4_9PEZI|nr:uncharacterized protein P152DRAFT_455872 [Eremomyces bilateralis CBS 781.70]KAF1814833.1 hypothetical protein P152DRAFT_455872 [Eremomyces bilateralis CBS 781.70]
MIAPRSTIQSGDRERDETNTDVTHRADSSHTLQLPTLRVDQWLSSLVDAEMSAHEAASSLEDSAYEVVSPLPSDAESLASLSLDGFTEDGQDESASVAVTDGSEAGKDEPKVREWGEQPQEQEWGWGHNGEEEGYGDEEHYEGDEYDGDEYYEEEGEEGEYREEYYGEEGYYEEEEISKDERDRLDQADWQAWSNQVERGQFEAQGKSARPPKFFTDRPPTERTPFEKAGHLPTMMVRSVCDTARRWKTAWSAQHPRDRFMIIATAIPIIMFITMFTMTHANTPIPSAQVAPNLPLPVEQAVTGQMDSSELWRSAMQDFYNRIHSADIEPDAPQVEVSPPPAPQETQEQAGTRQGEIFVFERPNRENACVLPNRKIEISRVVTQEDPISRSIPFVMTQVDGKCVPAVDPREAYGILEVIVWKAPSFTAKKTIVHIQTVEVVERSVAGWIRSFKKLVRRPQAYFANLDQHQEEAERAAKQTSERLSDALHGAAGEFEQRFREVSKELGHILVAASQEVAVRMQDTEVAVRRHLETHAYAQQFHEQVTAVSTEIVTGLSKSWGLFQQRLNLAAEDIGEMQRELVKHEWKVAKEAKVKASRNAKKLFRSVKEAMAPEEEGRTCSKCRHLRMGGFIGDW